MTDPRFLSVSGGIQVFAMATYGKMCVRHLRRSRLTTEGTNPMRRAIASFAAMTEHQRQLEDAEKLDVDPAMLAGLQRIAQLPEALDCSATAAGGFLLGGAGVGMAKKPRRLGYDCVDSV